MYFLLNWSLFRGHVSFPEGNGYFISIIVMFSLQVLQDHPTAAPGDPPPLRIQTQEPLKHESDGSWSSASFRKTWSFIDIVPGGKMVIYLENIGIRTIFLGNG